MLLFLFSCLASFFPMPSSAELIIDPYGPGSGVNFRNTNVRWVDEPNYLSYPELTEDGHIFVVSKQSSDFTIVSSDITGGYKVSVIPDLAVSDNPDEAAYMKEGRYLMRDDISADVDLYFDMLSSSLFIIKNNSSGDIDLINKKLNITLKMGNFDELVNSKRKLIVVRSFYTDSGGNHYYIPADETTVDIKNKTIHATISDLPNSLKVGEDGNYDVFGAGKTRCLDIMFGYSTSGTIDLIPTPIEHVSSTDIVSGDDTMGEIISDLPLGTSTDLLVKQEDGTYFLDEEKTKENLPEFKDGYMIQIPVFAANVKSEDIAIVTQSLTINALNEKTFAEISVLKARNDGTVGKLKWASSPALVSDGEYYISEKRTGTVVDKSQKPKPGRQYVLYMGIKDNGVYDLDPAVGKILDPAIIATQKTTGGGSEGGSGGGGCNTSAGGLGLLLMATLISFAYKKDK